MSLSAKSIVALEASQEIASDVWKDMVDFYVECLRSLEDFEEKVLAMEIEHCEEYYSSVPEAKTKAGKWKKSFTNDKGETIHIIPQAWKTAKSVIINAVSTGSALTDPQGGVRGQSAVQKDININRRKSDPADNNDLAVRYVNKLYGFLKENAANLNPTTALYVRDVITDMQNITNSF